MKKVYLVLQRHIIKQSKSRCVWSEWYPFSIDACYLSIDDALQHILLLRQEDENRAFAFVDYRVKVLFVH